MKENIPKILDILTKDELNKEDREFLENLLASDEEVKEFFKKFKKIEDLIKASSHISEEDLSEYILFKNNNAAGDIDNSKIQFIEEHVKQCARCGLVYLQLSEEYSDINNYVANNLTKPEERSFGTGFLNFSYSKSKFFRYAFLSTSIAILLFFSLTVISQLTTPQNYKLAEIDHNSLNYVTRGRASNEFQKGLVALDQNNFNDAVNYFKKDISENKNSETIFYTYYILGLTYLENSEQNFVGLFTSYDDKMVNNAVENFRECIQKNNSQNFPDITANSFFFLAKADLMLNDVQQAKKNLQMVINLKGSRSDKAKELLDKLE